ncbi:MAG: DUF4331 family protein [Flavobacteriaceae bacterium]|nr:DUF4331 family protein [Flavobacteriaceae bacterium]
MFLAVTVSVLGIIAIAADHIDAPAVAGGTGDITDFYAFQGENTDNIVFIANIQGLLSPSATTTADFDENILIEFNIDTDSDAIEDLVIQAIPREGKMYFFGPFSPSSTGLDSSIGISAIQSQVDITPYSGTAIIAENSGMKFFAGPRDDPFFMDFARYGEIIGGTATAFNNPGSDTFAGTNVMSIVIEVPKSMIGGTGTINTWVEAKSKN